jgi:nucleoside 2-deoxyribosyltransferase
MTRPRDASGGNMKIYLAGPLFSAAEQDFNASLAASLREMGYTVRLPQELDQRRWPARKIFRRDVRGINWADVVVANMDGPDPDSGTCWECGYAYRKKPVIVFRTDFRAAEDPRKARYNLMLTESATIRLDARFNSVERLAKRLAGALNKLPKPRARGRSRSKKPRARLPLTSTSTARRESLRRDRKAKRR